MSEFEAGQGQKRRGAVYIDGFNLYHPIDSLGKSYLKWASLWALSESFCRKKQLELVTVVFCTAVPTHLPDSRDRHNIFNAAQRAHGVEVIKGHHVWESDRNKYAEKQSDINVALSLIVDGMTDQYDVAYLLSADSDQVATARVFTENLSSLGKELIGVAPIGRSPPSGYQKYGIKGFSISEFDLEKCVMPEMVQGKTAPVIRPTEYCPPNGWVHPNDRPKGKPPKARKKWGASFKG